jgi:hypothetical protein
MLHIPLINRLLHSHQHHHTHHADDHQDHLHGTKEKHIEQFILKSLESGHEMFIIVELLKEHGWTMEDIQAGLATAQQNEKYKEQIKKSNENIEKSRYELNLIINRLKENNCCPLCYFEFDNNMKMKTISPCCHNAVCRGCVEEWCLKMEKKNCIYCNTEKIHYTDYVIINTITNNFCSLCNIQYKTENDKYYSKCCIKKCCINCLNEWYYKLFKNKCLFCLEENIVLKDYKNKVEYEEEETSVLSNYKYIEKTKYEFIEYFISTKMYKDCKVIFCSKYVKIFNDMKKLFLKYNIKYLELDDGNIESINISLKKYKEEDINVLLFDSNLFGCGLNLQCTTDIVFLHKIDNLLEKQIIGRALRLGRNGKLNLWYLMHENEKIFYNTSNNNNININDINDINKNNQNNYFYNYNTIDDNNEDEDDEFCTKIV